MARAICTAWALLAAAAVTATRGVTQETALIGATVIDVSDAGRDLEDAIVLLSNGRIAAVGTRDAVEIPRGVHPIDVTGRFIVPGLIDSFAAINGQRHADAYVYSGVTSILGVSSGRRGGLFTEGAPSPHVYRKGSIGSDAAPSESYGAQLERLALEGTDAVLLMYELEPEELRTLAARARTLGIATIGELGRTTYLQGAEIGLDAFVHTTRYSLDIAPEAMRTAVADEPFSDDLESAKWRYYLHLSGLGGDDRGVLEHAAALARGGAALIPTLSLLYLDMPWARNPWDAPVAGIIDPETIHRPADPATGRHADYANDPAHEDAYGQVAAAVMRIERANVSAGNVYIAGSATDVWGSMPGISLHTELEGLVRTGLTPREALRAATWNPTEIFGWRERGRIEAGAIADLLVLDADPREDVAALQAIDAVFLAGEAVDRAALLARPRDLDGEIVDQEPWPLPADALDLTPGAGAFRPGRELLGGVELSEITYLSDGLRVKAALAVPRGPGPFPAVVYCRGGNREFGAITPERAARFMSTVASWGYVVVAPQYRGNRGGEGREEFGGADVNDVLHVLPLIDAHPRADPERVGIYGGSRGGMMALLAMRRTDRFRAAVLRCALTDLVTWPADRPGIEAVYEELIPNYSADDPAPLVARSPVHWADELPRGTPILALHGTADWRVSPASALRFAAALQATRHPYRLVMLEGADHSLSECTAERDALTREWLDRFVRDGAPLPDMEPHGD